MQIHTDEEKLTVEKKKLKLSLIMFAMEYFILFFYFSSWFRHLVNNNHVLKYYVDKYVFAFVSTK